MANGYKCTKNMSSDEHLMQALSKEPSLDSFLDTLFRVISRETDFYRNYDQKTGEAFLAKYISKYAPHCVCGDTLRPEVDAGSTHFDSKRPSTVSNCELKSMSEMTAANSTKCGASTNRVPIDRLVSIQVNNDYNGATCQHYSWSQAINEIDVIVPIASNVTSSRHVRVFIRSDDLTVLVNNAGNWVHKVNGRLCYTIRPINSMWTLHPSSHIHICLEKERERWWNALIDGEEQLGVGSKDRSVQFEHLTQDAQAMVQKLAYEQFMKSKHSSIGD